MGRNWQPKSGDSETLLKIKEEMSAIRKKTADEMSARMKPKPEPRQMLTTSFEPSVDMMDEVEEEAAQPVRTKNISAKFTYDRTGRLLGAVAGRRTFAFKRAAQGRIQSAVDNKNVGIEFIYDQNGRVTGAKSGKRKFVFNRNKQTGRIQSAMAKHMESVNA